MSNKTIVANNLFKKFGSFAAVDGVSFKVDSGEIYGFLGPNGAGKSTTIAMLTTLTMPSEGQALIGGWDVVKEASKVREVAGVALQEIGLDPVMKSTELLTLQARLFGFRGKQARQRAMELIGLVRLEDVTDRPVGKYSGGMRRRLDLAMALVHQPDILFLDEPTTGLDPASRRDVWNEIRRLNREVGMTIFLTTQYLEEADELANRVGIINHGKLQVEGAPEALKAQIGGESINLTFSDSEASQRASHAIADMAQQIQLDQQTLRLYLSEAARVVPTVISRLEAQNLRPISLTLSRPTLDDVFLQVTGERYANNEAASNVATAVKSKS